MRKLYTSAAALVAAFALAAPAAAQWKPTKPITIIVPWAAGGSTDQVTRVTAAELEKALGQKVVIVNQPGASGSIGTKNALEGAEGRLHLDRRRGAGPRHLQGARHARHQDRRLEAVPQRRQRAGGRRQREHAVQEHQPADRRDEGQAGRRSASPRRASTPAATTRWRRSRAPPASSTSTSPTTAATPRSSPPSRARPTSTTQLAVEQAEMIRGKRIRPLATRRRQADRDRGLRHHRADHQVAARLQGAGQLLRHLHAEGRAARGDRDGREDLGRADREERGAASKYATSRGALFAPGGRRRRAEGRVPGGAGQRVAAVRERQGEGRRRTRSAFRSRKPAASRRRGAQGPQGTS